MNALVCKSGEIVLSPDAPLLATLGSCVSVIAHDHRTGVYGLNHYLLPDPSSSSRNSDLGELEFGSHSIPTLFRMMKDRGSKKNDLSVWVVGGANQFQSMSEVGRLNIALAEIMLRRLDIPVRDHHVGGYYGRRVEVDIARSRISIWLLTGKKDRSEPDAIFEVPTF